MANKDIRKEKDSGNRKPSPQSKKICLECGDRKAPSYTMVCNHCHQAHAGKIIPYEFGKRYSTYNYKTTMAILNDIMDFIDKRRKKRNNVK